MVPRAERLDTSAAGTSARGEVGDSTPEIRAESDDHVIIEVSNDANADLWEAQRVEDGHVGDVREEELVETRADADSAELSASPVASTKEEELPDFRQRQPGRKTLATAVASAVAVVVAGVVWSGHVSPAEHSTASVAAAAPEPPVKARALEPRVSELAPSPATVPTSEATRSSASAFDGVVGPSGVKTVPAAAATVKAASVRKRAWKRRVESAPQSDSPYLEPSDAAKVTTAPVPTADSATESVTQAVPIPVALPADPSAE
jgi:hypothetical protein